MNLDLTNLITSHIEEIEVDSNVVIPNYLLENSEIKSLKDLKFVGTIEKLLDGGYQISGNLTGVMILPDNITLEDVEVNLSCEIEENFSEFGDYEEKKLEIVKNRLDITEFLWQNILVEIPLRVISEKNEDLTLEGDGWRLITEEELIKSNNSPFSELSKIFDSRKE